MQLTSNILNNKRFNGLYNSCSICKNGNHDALNWLLKARYTQCYPQNLWVRSSLLFAQRLNGRCLIRVEKPYATMTESIVANLPCQAHVCLDANLFGTPADPDPALGQNVMVDLFAQGILNDFATLGECDAHA